MTARAYMFNRANFAFEVFTDEVVILNVTEGAYFALGGWAFDIWPDLASRQPVDRLVEVIARRYGKPREAIETELNEFVAKLQQEQILLDAAPSDRAMAQDEPTSAAVFRPITFEKHVDMEDLLTLDPIHDVDPQQGWPNYRPPS